MKKLIYKGLITEKEQGFDTAYDALFIGEMEDPIAREFEEKIQGKCVHVKYWISDTEKN